MDASNSPVLSLARLATVHRRPFPPPPSSPSRPPTQPTTAATGAALDSHRRMARRRTLQILLIILALFLVGTVVVLSSISIYLSIGAAAYLTEVEVGYDPNETRWNASEHGVVERVPRILHQTWKTETLPDRWVDVSRGCRDMMPDYQYVLWTDADSREFIAKEYPWFLDTFDAYTYPIQRADAIRYFVLYHYGGVYLDLDVGCKRPLDRLLVYPVILPKTIPVGVSNDLMFAEKGHPFMAQTIHNLVTFDHSWVLNYPTVMFSTGPMFLSAQYGIWTSSHPPTPEFPGGEVRILPKALYGKNAKPEEAPHSFFSHFYGSSWHADDAAFIGFLGKWGKGLMWVGFVILIVGIARLAWQKKKRSERVSRSGGIEVLLPRAYHRNGRWHFDLGSFTLTARGLSSGASTSSAPSSGPPSPTLDEENVPMLPLSSDVGPLSPPTESISGDSMSSSGSRRYNIVEAIYRAHSRVVNTVRGHDRNRVRSTSRPNWSSRGVLFFLPAIFTPATTTTVAPELGSRRTSISRSSSRASLRAASSHPEKRSGGDDLDGAALHGASLNAYLATDGSTQRLSRSPTPGPADLAMFDPPPYSTPRPPRGPTTIWSPEQSWEDWDSR